MKATTFLRIILIVFLSSLFSCKSVPIIDRGFVYNFNFVNKTAHNIGMNVFIKDSLLKSYEILSFDTLTYTNKAVFGVSPFEFDGYFDGYFTTILADSIFLTFDNTRYVSFIREKDTIFYADEYETNIINDTLRICYYYFTEEDYENAVLIVK